MDKEKSFSEKIKEEIEYSKVVPIKFPAKVLDRFRHFCLEESADCWWLGIEKLIQEWERSREIDSRTFALLERIQFLDHRIDELEIAVKGLTEKKRERTRFGKVEEK